MRTFRSAVFVFVAFLFLGTLTGVDSVMAADGAPSIANAVPVVEPIEQSVVDKFVASVPGWLQALSLLISAFAAIAALTPTPKDDGVLSVLRKIVDLLALNFGGAKNAAVNKDSVNRP